MHWNGNLCFSKSQWQYSRPVKLEALFEEQTNHFERSTHRFWSSNPLLQASISVPNLFQTASPNYLSYEQQQIFNTQNNNLRTKPIENNTNCIVEENENSFENPFGSFFPSSSQWAPFSAPATIMASNYGQNSGQGMSLEQRTNGRPAKVATNSPSRMLEDSENRLVFSLLDRKCQVRIRKFRNIFHF